MYHFNNYLTIDKMYDLKTKRTFTINELIESKEIGELELCFEVIFNSQNITVFSINNLYNDTKVYINNQEYNIKGSWFERIIFESLIGINQFVIKITVPSLSCNFKIELYNYHFHKLLFNNFEIYDDYNDVKKYKIKNLNYTNKKLNICVSTNTILISKEVKIAIFLEKINKIKLLIERKKIADKIIQINKNEIIDLSYYKIPNDAILQIGILENEQQELFYDEKYILPNNVYEQIDEIKNYIVPLYFEVIKEKKWSFKYFHFMGI